MDADAQFLAWRSADTISPFAQVGARPPVILLLEYGTTVAVRAALEGDLPVLKTLYPSCLTAKDSLGRTPLIAAIYGLDTLNVNLNNLDYIQQTHPAHLDVVRFLLATIENVEAHVNAQYEVIHGITPLILAAYFGKHDLVKVLLEGGADVDAVDSQNATALMYAARDNHVHVIQLLLQHSASPDARDVNGWSALEYGCKYNDTRELLDGSVKKKYNVMQTESPISTQSRDIFTELSSLAISSVTLMSTPTTTMTLPPISISSPERLQKTMYRALLSAIQTGNLEQWKSLLADSRPHSLLNVPDVDSGFTILHYLMQHLSTHTFTFLSVLFDIVAESSLIDRDTHFISTKLLKRPYTTSSLVDLNVPSRSGRTALHYLASASYNSRALLRPILQLLLANDAHVNVADHAGSFPLHLACEGNHTELIQVLIEHGATILVRNHKNQTPIDLTTDMDIIRLLKHASTDFINSTVEPSTSIAYTPRGSMSEIHNIQTNGLHNNVTYPDTNMFLDHSISISKSGRLAPNLMVSTALANAAIITTAATSSIESTATNILRDNTTIHSATSPEICLLTPFSPATPLMPQANIALVKSTHSKTNLGLPTPLHSRAASSPSHTPTAISQTQPHTNFDIQSTYPAYENSPGLTSYTLHDHKGKGKSDAMSPLNSILESAEPIEDSWHNRHESSNTSEYGIELNKSILAQTSTVTQIHRHSDSLLPSKQQSLLSWPQSLDLNLQRTDSAIKSPLSDAKIEINGDSNANKIGRAESNAHSSSSQDINLDQSLKIIQNEEKIRHLTDELESSRNKLESVYTAYGQLVDYMDKCPSQDTTWQERWSQLARCALAWADGNASELPSDSVALRSDRDLDLDLGIVESNLVEVRHDLAEVANLIGELEKSKAELVPRMMTNEHHRVAYDDVCYRLQNAQSEFHRLLLDRVQMELEKTHMLSTKFNTYNTLSQPTDNGTVNDDHSNGALTDERDKVPSIHTPSFVDNSVNIAAMAESTIRMQHMTEKNQSLERRLKRAKINITQLQQIVFSFQNDLTTTKMAYVPLQQELDQCKANRASELSTIHVLLGSLQTAASGNTSTLDVDTITSPAASIGYSPSFQHLTESISESKRHELIMKQLHTITETCGMLQSKLEAYSLHNSVIREQHSQVARDLDVREMEIKHLESQLVWLKVTHDRITAEHSQCISLQADTITNLQHEIGNLRQLVASSHGNATTDRAHPTLLLRYKNGFSESSTNGSGMGSPLRFKPLMEVAWPHKPSTSSDLEYPGNSVSDNNQVLANAHTSLCPDTASTESSISASESIMPPHGDFYSYQRRYQQISQHPATTLPNLLLLEGSNNDMMPSASCNGLLQRSQSVFASTPTLSSSRQQSQQQQVDTFEPQPTVTKQSHNLNDVNTSNTRNGVNPVIRSDQPPPNNHLGVPPSTTVKVTNANRKGSRNVGPQLSESKGLIGRIKKVNILLTDFLSSVYSTNSEVRTDALYRRAEIVVEQ